MMMQWQATPDHADDYALQRRGYDLGAIKIQPSPSPSQRPNNDDFAAMWNQHQAVLLPAWVADDVAALQAAIADRESWVASILAGDYPSEHLAINQDDDGFSFVGSSDEEHDVQAIEKMFFADGNHDDAHDNLWCKASWLSFHDDDASLRFRFSFGMEGFEDVAADPARQQSAAQLCTALFPESAAIEQNNNLNTLMDTIVGGKACYVERIVYFNAPNGGAQMHHDVERGHAGVVYAQLTGETFWLALAKPLLVAEIQQYSNDHPQLAQQLFANVAQQTALEQLLLDDDALNDYLDQDDHELLEVLIDQQPDFIRHMTEQGHGFVLQAGDVLLLPQQDLAHCVWHTVFCLGDDMGEALSFAVRPSEI